MIIGAIFGGAGLVGGFCFRLVPFVIFMLVAIAGYVCLAALDGTTTWALALNALIALIASQVGYFLAVLLRLMLKKRQKSTSAAPVKKPEPSTPR